VKNIFIRPPFSAIMQRWRDRVAVATTVTYVAVSLMEESSQGLANVR